MEKLLKLAQKYSEIIGTSVEVEKIESYECHESGYSASYSWEISYRTDLVNWITTTHFYKSKELAIKGIQALINFKKAEA